MTNAYRRNDAIRGCVFIPVRQHLGIFFRHRFAQIVLPNGSCAMLKRRQRRDPQRAALDPTPAPFCLAHVAVTEEFPVDDFIRGMTLVALRR